MRPFRERYEAYIAAGKRARRPALLVSILAMGAVLFPSWLLIDGLCESLVARVVLYFIALLVSLVVSSLCDTACRRVFLRCYFARELGKRIV